MTNIREFYSSLSTRVVSLWQTAEDLSLTFRQNINLVNDIISNCEVSLLGAKQNKFQFLSIENETIVNILTFVSIDS